MLEHLFFCCLVGVLNSNLFEFIVLSLSLNRNREEERERKLNPDPTQENPAAQSNPLPRPSPARLHRPTLRPSAARRVSSVQARGPALRVPPANRARASVATPTPARASLPLTARARCQPRLPRRTGPLFRSASSGFRCVWPRSAPRARTDPLYPALAHGPACQPRPRLSLLENSPGIG